MIFNNVDFDAYSLFARTIEYVQQASITFGKQLLGTIFFIIPRALWQGKPEHSGVIVSAAQGQEFTNLSCPIMAEGYINFGFLRLDLIKSRP